ncbi:hypothetical protein ON010_g10455 [Phytophthora cinnamomi]|nr:hypothetical protein ON010_g10455 [Phytophthora cinnamomi]
MAKASSAVNSYKHSRDQGHRADDRFRACGRSPSVTLGASSPHDVALCGVSTSRSARDLARPKPDSTWPAALSTNRLVLGAPGEPQLGKEQQQQQQQQRSRQVAQ